VEHPQYAAIHRIKKELHARVADPVTAPCRIRHSAYLLPADDSQTRDLVQRRFEEIVQSLDVPSTGIHWGQRNGRFETPLMENARLRVVWELHSEFYSYTTYLLVDPTRYGPDTLVPSFTFPAMPALGTKLVDLDLAVYAGEELSDPLKEFLGVAPYYGGRVVNGKGQVWTNFQVDEWGQGRFVVRAGSLSPGRLGRLIRRLVEIENYTHLILYPLEEYRLQMGTLVQIERRVAQRSEDIATALFEDESDPDNEHRKLVALTRDMADLIRLAERMRHKISAASSYYAIFTERFHWLRERTGGGYQSLEEFLTARIAPAIRNYRNFMDRTEALNTQITSLGNMMRTRVNLNLERQNLQTIQAMNRRVELQLLLQRTVEGLSLIVLCYYLTGLTGYVLKALDVFFILPAKPEVIAAALIPVWIGAVWTLTRRVTHAVEKRVTKG